MERKKLDIAIVLVGFNSRRYLVDCLQSLAGSHWGGYTHQVVYVDNASSDGSSEMVRQQWPEVRVIENATNVGFCAACNQGVSASDGRYVYLLNVDTVVFPDTIRLLAEFLDERGEVGAVGNRLLNGDHTEQWSARRFPTWKNALFGRRSWLGRKFPDSRPVRRYLYKDDLSKGEPFRVDWVPGSCTLVRREAYERIGGLPPEMHYWSDAVFCDRLNKAGWEIFTMPGAPLLHFEGNSTGVKSAAVRKWLISDFHRGAYQFYCEHYRLGPVNPLRWAAKLGLSSRAALLIMLDAVRSGAALSRVPGDATS